MTTDLFPLIVGGGLLTIAFNMSYGKEHYNDHRIYPGLEWGLGLGNEHIGLTYSQKMVPYIEQVGNPGKHFVFLDLHNKFRRNYNVDHADTGHDETVYHEARMGSGVIGDYRVRSEPIGF